MLIFYFIMMISTSFGPTASADGIDPRYIQDSQAYQKLSTEQLRAERGKVGDELGNLLMKRHVLRELLGYGVNYDRWIDIPQMVRGELLPPAPVGDWGAFAKPIDDLGWYLDKRMMKFGYKKDEDAFFLMAQKMTQDGMSSLEQKLIDDTTDQVIRAHAILDELCRRHAMRFESFFCRDSLMTDPVAMSSSHAKDFLVGSLKWESKIPMTLRLLL